MTTKNIAVTTSDRLEGYEVTQYLGIVRGIVVRATGIGRGILGSLKSIVGGNVESFTKVCEEARLHAFERMVHHAEERDADAIIAMRYDATEFMGGVTEVLAYGTAVKVRPTE
jgi:uncharacterized protein YbjQ (UPF0145 family)